MTLAKLWTMIVSIKTSRMIKFIFIDYKAILLFIYFNKPVQIRL